MNKKIVLVDGNSIINRAFYGIPDLTNKDGFHTNAIYGFLNIILKIIEEENASYLAVAFDVKAPTFRHELYKEYKGTRKPMPEELRQQVPVLKEVLMAMNILILEKAGLEADDILGTLAKEAETLGYDVSLVSGDRDLLQIASKKIKIRIPKTKAGKTIIEDYYEEDVKEIYQVTPQEFIELKALMGDPSDNIPGVPKVGEKTATELIKKYHSIEGIYENIELITKKAIKESLLLNRELANLSKILVTIETKADFDYDFADARFENPYTKEAYDLFKKLEFKNLLNKFENIEQPQMKESLNIQMITQLGECEEFFKEVKKQEYIGICINSIKEEIISVAITFKKEAVFVILVEGFLTSNYIRDKLFESSKKTKMITFGCKKLYPFVSLETSKNYFDILIGAYLNNATKNNYEVEDIADEYLDVLMKSRMEYVGKLKDEMALSDQKDAFVEYIAMNAYISFMSYIPIRKKLEELNMYSLFETVEMPLSIVLYQMENEGIQINKDELKAYGEMLSTEILRLEDAIYEKAGCQFNINSPKQLGEILFEKLEIPGGKKTKTGYSTAAQILETLSDEYTIVADILEYRGLAKLKSTYVEGLLHAVAEDGKIHTNFNQTITATGRISSTDPNLQNIPMRTELGRMIRKVFIPKDGFVFIDADYSQIELRLLAHMSGDEALIQAYKTDSDIHRITASQVFHIPFDEVDDTHRRNAKAVNFGIVYGISSFGLSKDLSISRKEAGAYIEQYFKTYPKVKGFLDGLILQGKKQGYVTTLYNRRRDILELSSSNFMTRSFGERIAMNSPIQGTAADIMKIAMIRVYNRLKEEGMNAKLLIQVHDELLIETPEHEVEKVKEVLMQEMKEAVSLSVSLEIDIHVGKNWYEAK
ncbi:MAG: DNA polymerase I [Lachnospiraceae bacterium]